MLIELYGEKKAIAGERRHATCNFLDVSGCRMVDCASLLGAVGLSSHCFARCQVPAKSGGFVQSSGGPWAHATQGPPVANPKQAPPTERLHRASPAARAGEPMQTPGSTQGPKSRPVTKEPTQTKHKPHPNRRFAVPEVGSSCFNLLQSRQVSGRDLS